MAHNSQGPVGQVVSQERTAAGVTGSASQDRFWFPDNTTPRRSGDAFEDSVRPWCGRGDPDVVRAGNTRGPDSGTASPHPRQGAGLSANVPLDANHNPANAFLDETRLTAAVGTERQLARGASLGITGSFTHSGQSQFRGFLTSIANSPNNAAGFRENIDVNDVYADAHVTWAERR
jgi:hypothetical protein